MKTKFMTVVCSLLVSVFSFSGCSIGTQKTVEDVNEHSNLEIKLLTPADEVDFSDFGIIPGFGVTGYYDKKYGDWDADIESVSSCYVRYNVTAYPDYMSGDLYVTGIDITDPEIEIYGYSVGENSEAFKETLEEEGFKLYENALPIKRFKKGKVKIRFGVDPETQRILSIAIEVNVTNHCGVVF